jgi:arginyl-tRNA synthetase
LFNTVKTAIERAIGRAVVLEKPKDSKMGHLAITLAFSLAKELGKSPTIIAQELAVKLQDIVLFDEVSSVGGFVNFKLAKDFLENLSNNILNNKPNQKTTSRAKILLEFVSANPTGPLHIGHSRGAVQGSAIANIGKYLGYDITTEYYINDAGKQIDLLGLSLYLEAQAYLFGLEVEYPQDYYRGQYLTTLCDEIAQKFGKDIFKTKNNIETIGLFAKDKVLELIKHDLQLIGVSFDNFVAEKPLYKHWQETKKELEANDALYKKDGKLWLASTKYGDELDRVVTRDNDKPTYLAGDIIYHQQKFQRGFDTLINIWGADHHGYITRVKASLEFLGYDSKNLQIILSQMVSLLKDGKPYKMSKRAGNTILLCDIVDEIGADSLRFVFLSKKSDTHLEFDVQSLQTQDQNNPVFYINYANARINQLFTKAGVSIDQVVDYRLDNLNDELGSLLFEAILLNRVLQESFDKRQPHLVAIYLQNLSAAFHKFYTNNKIVGALNQNQILKTIAVVSQSITLGLKLLGIKAKKRM